MKRYIKSNIGIGWQGAEAANAGHEWHKEGDKWVRYYAFGTAIVSDTSSFRGFDSWGFQLYDYDGVVYELSNCDSLESAKLLADKYAKEFDFFGDGSIME